jgi:hypothetical protein
MPKQFDESKVNRDGDGKFDEKPGGGGGSDAEVRRMSDFIAARYIEKLRREGKLKGGTPGFSDRLKAASAAAKARSGDAMGKAFDESKHPRDGDGRWAKKDDSATGVASAAGDFAGALAGGIVGDSVARRAMQAAASRWGVTAATTAGRFAAPALEVGARLALGGAAATGVGLVGSALGIGAVHGFRAFQEWQRGRDAAAKLESSVAAIKGVERRVLSGEISPRQAKQEFIAGGASAREAGYMVSRINRMARAEKAFMVGSALGEADVLLQKKDGRAGRDGDGDGKLNEGKDGERLASPENIAMGTAAVGSIGGTVAGSRVGQRIVRAKVNRLLDRGIKRSMSGLEQMTQSLEMRLDDQPHLRGKAKVLERIGRVNARYGKKLIQAASKILSLIHI